MIQLTVRYPTAVSSIKYAVFFTATYQGHLDDSVGLGNLEDIIPYIKRFLARSNIAGIIDVSLSTSPTNTFVVTLGPHAPDWRLWYIIVIDAIMAYYRKNDSEAREIVHSTAPLTKSEPFHDQSVQYHPY